MGNAGVDFFFVLSGFLIFYIHQKDFGKPSKLATYLRKRTLRIFPIYWIVTLILIPVYFIIPAYGQGDETKLSVILGSLFLLPMERAPILVAGWSLIHELLFYFIFALLIGIRGRWVWALAGMWVLGLLYTLANSTTQVFQSAFPNLTPLQHLIWWPQNLEFVFGAGAAAYIASPTLPKPSRRACLWILPLSLVTFLFIGSLVPTIHSLQIASHIVIYGLLSVLIIISSTQLDLIGGLGPKISGSRLFRTGQFLGDASYSIYLIHGPALSVLFKLAGKARLFDHVSTHLVNTAIILVTLGVGCLFHSVVERPLLNASRRRIAGSASC